MPFPQAVPQIVLIDPEACIEFKSHKCKKTCVEACGERNAIDFNQQESFEEIEVGTIIVSTGFKTFDATDMPTTVTACTKTFTPRWRSSD